MIRMAFIGFLIGYTVIGPWFLHTINCCPGVGLKGPG